MYSRLCQQEWRDYRKSLRTLFLAQNRRLMLRDELVSLKSFYEKTEALNTIWEEAFYEMASSYEEGDNEKYLSREEAILDIACYQDSYHSRTPFSTNEWYIEAITHHAPVLNTLFQEYFMTVENMYREYLEKIGVSDMKLDISLLEKTQP